MQYSIVGAVTERTEKLHVTRKSKLFVGINTDRNNIAISVHAFNTIKHACLL